jgi:hypothetical protein
MTSRWADKPGPFLGKGSVNTFPLLGSRFVIMQQLDYNNEELCFLRDPCRDVISKRQDQFSQFSSVRESVRRGIATVGAVTRKRLVTD